MASGVKVWFAIATLLLMFLSLKPLVAEPQVPCYFIFGDSLVDNGNNNNLSTEAKANYLPYGIDFPDGPTGRFSNGKNLADYLAEFLGFNSSIPPYSAVTTTEGLLKGVNYASGAGGILDESGTHMGEVISMDQQLVNHGLTLARIALYMKGYRAARYYLNKCFYSVGMGNNDYINNYLMPQKYPSSRLYTPDQFAELLAKKHYVQLKKLHALGARKVAVFGPGVLGCIPEEMETHGNGSLSCVDSINSAVQMFNDRMKPIIDDLNGSLKGAKFILINMTSLALGDPSIIGINNVNKACCQVSKTKAKGQCEEGQVPCSNRNEYMFWDNFHLTEIGNLGTATRSYTATLPTDAYPMDISSLLQLNLQAKSDI
ncbi:PREDICTED: GDSL esterase/lipase At1g29670-like [Ipomoea nil]|uniref:GDSL esterase/lipase At1g29670-like n=1 Tax=Ipomoea nil TaxID=35883 RepID=UPI00090179D1|nr:PREDICTED: GDSL esterase/lipase At1g29670-like [Ipomoea nil]